jgi:Ni,Fe-hydrogenase I large subunit
MGALFAGKMPHAAALVPGGVTERVSAIKMVHYGSILERLQTFIDTVYLPDVAAVAGAFPGYFELGKGCGNFLSYGVFAEGAEGHERFLPAGVLAGGQAQKLAPEAIAEDVGASLFSSPSGLKPEAGETMPAPDKAGAYSWLKAPNHQVMEVGPLARMLVAYHEGRNATLNPLIDTLLKGRGREPKDLVSVLGRHAARAIECKLVADRCQEWLEKLVPDEPACVDFQIPELGQGFGLTEAARGALGHWIQLRGGKNQPLPVRGAHDVELFAAR